MNARSGPIPADNSAIVSDSLLLRRWLKADFVVDRISKALLAAKVSLRRLDAYMAEQELDLLKLSTSFMTQAGASTP